MAKYEASSIDGSSFLLIFERFCSAFGLCGAVSHLQRNSSSPTGVETYPSVVRYGEKKLTMNYWVMIDQILSTTDKLVLFPTSQPAQVSLELSAPLSCGSCLVSLRQRQGASWEKTTSCLPAYARNPCRTFFVRKAQQNSRYQFRWVQVGKENMVSDVCVPEIILIILDPISPEDPGRRIHVLAVWGFSEFQHTKVATVAMFQPRNWRKLTKLRSSASRWWQWSSGHGVTSRMLLFV